MMLQQMILIVFHLVILNVLKCFCTAKHLSSCGREATRCGFVVKCALITTSGLLTDKKQKGVSHVLLSLWSLFSAPLLRK